MSQILLPHRRLDFRGGGGGGGPVNVSWATWDEITESGWGDSANNYICLMENASAGGNETGQGGGLSGADLVLTQTGSVAGATGSPPKRQFDGANDVLDATSSFVNGLFLGSTWTFIQKWNALVVSGLSLNFFWNSATDYLNLERDAGGHLRLYVADSGGNKATAYTTAAIPSSGDVWVMGWYDGGSGLIRCGWATSKPTKWSDFAANNRASVSNSISYGGLGGRTSPVGNTPGGHFPQGSLYYVIGSKKCLIDNAS